MALFQQANSSLKKMQIYWNTIDAKGGFHETFEYLQLRIFILPHWNKRALLARQQLSSSPICLRLRPHCCSIGIKKPNW